MNEYTQHNTTQHNTTQHSWHGRLHGTTQQYTTRCSAQHCTSRYNTTRFKPTQNNANNLHDRSTQLNTRRGKNTPSYSSLVWIAVTKQHSTLNAVASVTHVPCLISFTDVLLCGRPNHAHYICRWPGGPAVSKVRRMQHIVMTKLYLINCPS